MKADDILFEPSRSGSPTCRLGSLSLHSAYDPALEAERFVSKAIEAERRPSLVILGGPCLGYLSSAVRKLHPGAFIVSLQYSPVFEGREVAQADASFYFGSEGPSLASFLGRTLGEDSVSGVAYLDWPPAAQAFPAEAAEAETAVRSALDRFASEAATVKAFGRRWIANSCRSFLLAERLVGLRPTMAPIVVAASGPSLGRALEELAPFRGRFLLFAVSSSLAACRERGFEPDLVVATDGGPWSRHHLYPLAQRRIPLAAPLSGLPSASLFRGLPLLLLNQGFFPENELTTALGASIALGGEATDSGTSLRLATLATEGPIIAAGLDLASFDIVSHASPNGFDALLRSGEGRECPAESAIFARERPAAPDLLAGGPWRSSRTLALYASALSAEASGNGGRLFRLCPSPLALKGFQPLAKGEIGELLRIGFSHSQPLFDPLPLVGEEARRGLLAQALDGWREEALRGSASLASGELPASAKARELFRSIDLPDWAASRRAVLKGESPEPVRSRLEKASLDFIDELGRRLLA
jgi:hypothetical protein